MHGIELGVEARWVREVAESGFKSPLAHLCNLTFLSSLTRTPPPATLTDSLYTETWKQYFLQFSSGPQTVSAKIT